MYDNRPTLLDASSCLPVDEPFTLKQAQDAGLTKKQVGALVRDGYLQRPLRGVYVACQVPDSLELRTRMLALVVPAWCFVCDRTAAWLHGASGALAPDEHLAVPSVSCFRPRDQDRLRNALSESGERDILPRDLMELNGILVTTPLRTALDLGRLQRTRDLKMAGMDAMLRLGAFTHEEFLAEIPRFNRQRGVVPLRALAPLADGGAQSAGESALRLRWYDAGLPRPRTQIPVVENGRVINWLDMGLEELLFAAEYDGEEWHTSDGQVAHDRQRRGRLARRHGWQIEVFRRRDVYGVAQDADIRLRAAFRQARATLGQRTYVI